MKLTQKIIRDVLDYHPVTGQLFWKERPKCYFKYARDWSNFNRAHAGRECKNGYLDFKLFGTTQQKSRMVWLYHTGFLLDGNKWKILTVNRNRHDTRIENLVYVPAYVAIRQKLTEGPANNRSTGIYGISYKKDKDMFRGFYVDLQGNRHMYHFESFVDAYYWRKANEFLNEYLQLDGRPTGLDMSIPYDEATVDGVDHTFSQIEGRSGSLGNNFKGVSIGCNPETMEEVVNLSGNKEMEGAGYSPSGISRAVNNPDTTYRGLKWRRI